MTLRLVLLALWVVLLVAPAGWWLRRRRRVDVFRSLPVPAAILGSDGEVAALGGQPGWPADAVEGDEVPPEGVRIRVRAPDGTPVALAGVSGGALGVVLEADAGLARRHRRVSTLFPLVQHEIRASLQGVLGHLSLLADEELSEAGSRSLAAGRREATRMIDLVDGAQMLARIGGSPPVRTVVPAATLLAEAMDGESEVSVHTPEVGVLVEASDWQVIRVLRNLVDNALRHGRPPVSVLARADGEAVLFAVCDGGPGLDADELAKLAAPFVRGAAAGPGTGLGLSVAAEVLAGHASRLEAVPGGVGFRLARFHP